MDIPAALDRRLGEAVDSLFKVGTVSGTSGTQVVVTVNGGTMTIPRITSYTPTVGDAVQIVCPPGRWFVVGKIA